LIKISRDLKIPESERHRFSKPLGNLIAGTRKETINLVIDRIKSLLKEGYEIKSYLVGDIVTQDFLTNDFLKKYIKLSIIDEKTQRNHIKLEYEEFFENIIEFKNPQGGIKEESFDLLSKIFISDKKTVLKIVEGEEDLLVLPLVSVIQLKETIKHLVFYGQPPITDSKYPIPEGIVMVDVNKGIQKLVNKFLTLMKN
jgi:uncharacterized protein (UPF0218 family)